MENNVTVSSNLQAKYNSFYDQNIEQWRKLGAIQKVDNIIELCKGLEIKKILDVGAGDGSILKLLDERAFGKQYQALEISQSGIEKIREKKIKSLQSARLFDGYNIPYNDKEFDLVICSHVIEHVEFPRQFLREIGRVAKYQCMEVPRDYKHNVDKKADELISYGHIWVYSPTLFRFLLATEKFQIIKDKKSFISLEMKQLQLKMNNKNSFTQNLKTKMIHFATQFAEKLVSEERFDLMINAYTVLTQKND